MNTTTKIAALAAAALTCGGTALAAIGTEKTADPDSSRSHPAAAAAAADRPERTRPAPGGPAARPLPTQPPGKLDKTKAQKILNTVLQRPAGTLRSKDEVDTVFGPLTKGRFRSELQAEQGELQENGWTQRGAPKVTALTITAQGGRTATMSACLDQSDVTVLDAEGRTTGGSGLSRARHLYDLVQEPGGTWRITAHRFPANPTC